LLQSRFTWIIWLDVFGERVRISVSIFTGSNKV
jgi:hypothetical protein